MSEMLTPSQVAQILKISVKTLRNWRKANTGPPWHRFSNGTIRYALTDLESYINANRTDTIEDTQC